MTSATEYNDQNTDTPDSLEWKRTIKQNGCLHMWEGQLADELNAAGIPFGEVVIKLPRYFTKENLHSLVVHPVMNALYPDKTSTSQLSTTQIQEVYKHASQIIAERTGVHVEWPDRFNQGVRRAK